MQLEKFDEAFDVLYKSAWNAAQQDGAYLNRPASRPEMVITKKPFP